MNQKRIWRIAAMEFVVQCAGKLDPMPPEMARALADLDTALEQEAEVRREAPVARGMGRIELLKWVADTADGYSGLLSSLDDALMNLAEFDAQVSPEEASPATAVYREAQACFEAATEIESQIARGEGPWRTPLGAVEAITAALRLRVKELEARLP